MNDSNPPSVPDPRLAILCGDASPEALVPPEQRAAAEQSLALLRRELAAPPLDRAKLLAALRAQPAPPRFARTPERSRLGLVTWLAAAALLALAAGLAAWFFARAPRNEAHQPEDKTPGAHGSEQTHPPEKLPGGAWRVKDLATLTPAPGSEAAPLNGGLMLLKSGRAELVTEGRLAAPVEIVSALDDMLRLSVAGPSRCALRVLPGGKGLALSAYDGAPEAVALRRMDDSAAFAAGRNVDGLLFPADPNLEKKRAPFVLWPDVTAALPPVTDGEVLLQLTNGRVLRGRVTAQTAQSVQLFGTWAGTSLTGLASGPAKVPESILAAEVAAWTPAETPRGRDTYARWLDERLPKQLEEAKRNWFVILSAAPNPDFYPYELISAEHLLPEVEYRVQRRGQERLFQIVPLDKDLGPGWEMDERGLPARIGATAPAARDADF